MKNKKTCVVTGGAGFLGSTLVPELLKQGYRVHVIDNLCAGKRERVPEEAQFHQVDIRHPLKLKETFRKITGEDGPIFAVFHLAALPRVQFSIDHPAESLSVNLEGLHCVFDVCRFVSVRRVVYSASSSAYGMQDAPVLHEELKPAPMSPYALQKYYGEHWAHNCSLHYGLETVSLRYFNIFGPNFDPKGAYPQAIGLFLDLKKQGKPLTVTGDGLQTRDCVYATDVARANILAAESDRVGKGEVINIGGGISPTILSIARMIGGPDYPIVHIPPRVEPRHTRASIAKAKELLGWEPTVSLEEGINLLKKLHGVS